MNTDYKHPTLIRQTGGILLVSTAVEIVSLVPHPFMATFPHDFFSPDFKILNSLFFASYHCLIKISA